jgi:ribosomal protein L37E
MLLSIIIPARNEQFLRNTIDDILKNKEAETEVIVVLDGSLPEEPIPQYPDVNIIYLSKSVGQRAATNIGVSLSRAKYVMKLDAHCALDQGFDRKMIEGFAQVGDDVTMVPIMRNLWAFDWKCFHCGKKWYQDNKPTVCDACGKGDKIKMKMLWIGKHNPQSTSYCFNAEPRFTYFEDWKHREQYIKDNADTGFTETMSLQGSCFMCTRAKYWELEICDEKLGSWGNQGIEVACKTWLSGGRVICNHHTWYAHLFRTKDKFGFPWPVSGNEQQQTKHNVKALFWENKWPQAIHPLSWLVDKFWPVAGWTEEDRNKL